MGGERPKSRRIIKSLALVALVIALTLAIGISAGFAFPGLQPIKDVVEQVLIRQTPYPTVTPVPTEEGSVDLLMFDGEEIASWSSAAALTSFEVTSYRVEELTLPQPMEVTVNGTATDVQKAWRITIAGGQFPVASLGYFIWLDDTSVPATETGRGLAGFVFEPSLLREGAKVGISYSDRIGLRQQLPVGLELQREPSR